MELLLTFFFLIFLILFLFMAVYLGRISLHLRDLKYFLMNRFKEDK